MCQQTIAGRCVVVKGSEVWVEGRLQGCVTKKRNKFQAEIEMGFFEDNEKLGSFSTKKEAVKAIAKWNPNRDDDRDWEVLDQCEGTNNGREGVVLEVKENECLVAWYGSKEEEETWELKSDLERL